MEAKKEKEIIEKFNLMKQELTSIAQKIGELEQEKEEHLLVINTIKTMEPTRKCFKLIGGILVEKTVETTLPLVEGNKEGIVNLMEQLGKTYKAKEDIMNEYKKTHNIQIKV